jgi:hypothetical protein
MTRLLPLLFLICFFLCTPSVQAQVMITEFMANNVEDIIDEDGNHEDWMEIYNSSLGVVNLSGWYLTDDAGQLRKWAFPAKSLQPGQYLVVFASNKDRRNPLANLHTNFKLSAGGEFLGLTKAEANGGTTVVQSWNAYPPQAADGAYGTAQTGTPASLVAAASTVKWLVPGNGTLGTTWRNEIFTETGWSTGVAALGMAEMPIVVAEANLMHRYNTTTATLTFDSSGLSRNGTNSGVTFLASDSDAGAAPLKRAGVMQFVGIENDQFSIPANAAYNVTASTICFWMRANPPTGAGNTGAMLWDRRPDYGTAGIVLVQLDDGKLYLQSNNDYCAFGTALNVSDNTWHHVTATLNTGAGQAVTIYVDGVAAGTANNSAAWGWTAAQAIELGRSHDSYWKRYTGQLDDIRFYNRILTVGEIAQIANSADSVMGTELFGTTGVEATDFTTDVSTMAGVNTTAYVRIPFTVTDASTLSGARLTVRFADGYAAWINGTPVASYNAPASPLWNSVATTSHDAGRSRITTFSLAAGAIHTGTNILAIQLLNSDIGDANVLLRPTLEAFPAISGTTSYLVTPTPGAANTLAQTTVGPHISNTTKNPVRPVGGAGSAPLTITTKVVPSLNPLVSVQLGWRTMWGGETLVAMTATGGGNYTAQIPTTGLTAGQMVRWRILARDTSNNLTTDPLFIDLDGIAGQDTDQYYGTVVQEAANTTQLPVLLWFVSDINAANTLAGTRCSVMYRDKFYDYVAVNIHGQSTQGFPKKSYNLNFNKDNRFNWAAGQSEIRSVNLLSNYADKAKLRNTMAYESWAASHHAASHFADRLHVRQVTGSAQSPTFYGLYDMVEDGNEEFLNRCGLDENGALYKMYNSLESVAGGEKKTREFESSADLQALIDNLNSSTRSLAQRRQYIYDNVSIPALVNFCAVHSMILNTDWGHKNYYIYRDTLGTKEWFTLPWDQDLSFGHTWTGHQGYFDDDTHSQGGLAVGGGGNWLMSVLYTAPELNAMFVRRMRSLMDQFLISSTATTGPWETRVTQLLDQIDPPGAAYLTDADLELQKWGYWTDGYAGGQLFSGTLDAATHDHGARKQVMRILNSNPIPPNVGSLNNTAAGLGNTTWAYLPGRRSFLYTQGPTSSGVGVPAAQPLSPTLSIEQINANPSSANQSDEYFVIKNTSGNSVDLSNWSLTGAVEYTFPGGTVIPAFTTGVDNIGLLHVAKSPAAFRVRTSGATGGQYRLVVGPYAGSLSARGESIELRRPDGTLLQSQSFAAAPTAAQNQLRVSEINYNPTQPTLAEISAIPGVSGSDFEFLELVNTGSTVLSLAGARFTKGIEFTFPLGASLAAGARVLLVSNQAAFTVRYGNVGTIGGQYLGNLSNSGDTLQLLDSVGEEVLEFHYEPSWFPQSDGGGYSLVTRIAAPGYAAYGTPSAPLPTVWALSATAGGTPGAGDTDFANGYEGWRFDYWTLAELTTLGALIGVEEDPDNDGMTNFTEYCFGKNPRVADTNALSTASTVTVLGIDYPAITITRRHLAVDVAWSIEESSDLNDWQPTPIVMSTQQLANGLEQITARSPSPNSNTRCFHRVNGMKN